MAPWLAPSHERHPSAPALGALTAIWLCLVAGLMHAAAVAWPFKNLLIPQGTPSGALQLLSLSILAALIVQEPQPRRVFACTWAYATAMLAGTFWWLVISMHQFGGMALPLAITAMLLLAMGLGLYYPLAMLLWRWLCPAGQKPVLQVLGFGLAWLAAELLRGQLFTGFPWGASGYAHIDSLLKPLAPLVGVYGLSLVAALLAAAWISVNQKWRVLSVVAMAAVYWLLPPSHSLWQQDYSRRMGEVKVALLQTNVAQDQKFNPTVLQNQLTWLSDQLSKTKAQLLIAPETAIPVLPDQLPPNYISTLEKTLSKQGKTALIGLPLDSQQGNGRITYANAAMAFGAGQTSADAPYLYKKQHLVPFGEFVPTGFRWFVDMMHIPLGDFESDDAPPKALTAYGQRFMPNICYEDLFGEELAQAWRTDLSPTVLVNMSNIAWFGNTVAIDQHLHIARMRALELARPMVRATNTGATAVIDHTGLVQSQLTPYTQGVLTHSVQAQSGDTPYVQWVSRLGLWPWWTLILLGFAGMAFTRQRKPAPPTHAEPTAQRTARNSRAARQNHAQSIAHQLAQEGRQDRQRH